MSDDYDRRAVKRVIEDSNLAMAKNVDLHEWTAVMVQRFIDLDADYIFRCKAELEAICRDAAKTMGVHAVSGEQKGFILGAILAFEGGDEPEPQSSTKEPGDMVTG